MSVENLSGLVYFVLLSYVIYLVTNLSKFLLYEWSNADNMKKKYKKLCKNVKFWFIFLNAGGSLESPKTLVQPPMHLVIIWSQF